MVRDVLALRRQKTSSSAPAARSASPAATRPAAPPTGVGLANPGVPVWLRLVRSGNTFTAYYGGDGVAWAQLAQVSVSLPQTVRLGLAAASYSTGTSTARFRDFGVVQQSAPVAVTGLSAAPQGSASVRLSWGDASDNELGFRVERRAVAPPRGPPSTR